MMFSLYFVRCEFKLSKCKQFDGLWNIVQEKDVISKCLNRKLIPKGYFLLIYLRIKLMKK